jgi:hypothetical protein
MTTLKPVIRFTIYPPAGPETPWLAVVLEGDKPLEAIGCVDRADAQQVLSELEARMQGRAFRVRA